MGIVAEDIARVRAATDFVQIASERMALKKSGASQWVGLCPFHAENSGSFSINAEKGVYYCVAGETRVVTWEGVRPIRELAGTTQRIMTQGGRWVDAPFRAFGTQRLWKVTVGRNGQTKDIFATPEHRWLLRGRPTRPYYERTTANLRPGHLLAHSFAQNRTKHLRELSPFGIAHGIVYGDGTRFARGTAVDLHGEKDAQLLKWFPLSRTYTHLRTHRGKSFVKVLDLPNYFKDRPCLDESSAYLAGWLAGYIAADGHVANDGTVMLNSADRTALEFVRDLCTRLGIGTYGITEQRRIGFPGREESSLYRVHFVPEDLDERFFLIDEHRLRFAGSTKKFARRGWTVKSIEPTDRFEEVFCAVVEGTHSFTLEDNILTGNCFGCQASGDVISFVREVEHLDFVAAVEKLASRANIALRYDNEAAGRDRQRRDVLIDAMEKAVDWYHERLLSSKEAGAARRYLRNRGYDKEIVSRFRIGWAPDDWDALSKALALPEKIFTDTGLGFVNRRNRQQDSFRGRVMFPIFDTAGKPVAFGGRVLPGSDDKAKYKNSPETPIYSKRRVLYGLNWAKADAVASGEVVVCEGYTDVIAFFVAGAPRAVATCGTAVTEEHLRVLRTFAPRIVLAYDADAAGQAAAERFYEWERELSLQLAVLDLPGGSDPADLARRDPAALRTALADARSFLDFRVERALSAADLHTLEGKAKAAELALGMIAEHPNELVRDQYLSKVAGRVDIPAEQLVRSLRGSGARAVVRPVVPNRPPVLGDGPETEALRVAIHRPADIAGLLHESLFREPAHHAAYLALEGGDPLPEVIENASPDAAGLLSRLAVGDTEADADDVVAGLVRVAAERAVAKLSASMATGADFAQIAPVTEWLKKQKELLSDQEEPEVRRGAIEALVTWLAEKVDGGEVS